VGLRWLADRLDLGDDRSPRLSASEEAPIGRQGRHALETTSLMKHFAALGLVVLLGLVLAGCGSSSSTTSTPSSSAAAATQSGPNAATLLKARVAAAVCMRAQGINVPDPSSAPGSLVKVLKIIAGYPTNKVQAAEQACATQIRQAFPNATSLTPEQRAQRLQQARAYAACMRGHGIRFPDPPSVAGNASAYLAQISALNASAPAFKSASTTCRDQVLNGSGG
jgi:hypothetical protein